MLLVRWMTLRNDLQENVIREAEKNCNPHHARRIRNQVLQFVHRRTTRSSQRCAIHGDGNRRVKAVSGSWRCGATEDLVLATKDNGHVATLSVSNCNKLGYTADCEPQTVTWKSRMPDMGSRSSGLAVKAFSVTNMRAQVR